MNNPLTFAIILKKLNDILCSIQQTYSIVPATNQALLSQIQAYNTTTIETFLGEPQLVSHYQSRICHLVDQMCVELRGYNHITILHEWLRRVKSHLAFYAVGHDIRWTEPASAQTSIGHSYGVTHPGAVIPPDAYSIVTPDDIEQLCLLIADCHFEITPQPVDKTYAYKGN